MRYTLPLLLAALAAAAPAHAESWRLSSRSGAASAYIDADSIRRDGDRVTFVREVRWPEPRTLQGDKRFDRMRAVYEAGCKAMTLQSLAIEARLGDAVLLSAGERGKLETVQPGSTAAADLAAACHGRWPTGG